MQKKNMLTGALRAFIPVCVLLATVAGAQKVAAVPRGTTLVDPIQPRLAQLRTTPKYPPFGAWGIVVGRAEVSKLGRGIAIEKVGQAVVYPSAQLLGGDAGTLEFSVAALAPSSGVGATAEERVLLDSIWAAPSLKLRIALTGSKLVATIVNDKKQKRELAADARWTTDSVHTLQLLWDARSVAFVVDGKQAAAESSFGMPVVGPLALVLGNDTELKLPGKVAVSDLRLSTNRDPMGHTPKLSEEPTKDVRIQQTAKAYADRLFPVTERMKALGMREAELAEALAFRDIEDTDRAMRAVAPIAADPAHPVRVEGIFLRADLLAEQKDYRGALDQLLVLQDSPNRVERAMARVKQAELLYQQGDTVSAMRMMGDLIDQYGDLPIIDNVYFRIGVEQFQRGNYDAAVGAFSLIGTSWAPPATTVEIGSDLELTVSDPDLKARLTDRGLKVTVAATSGDSFVATLRPTFSSGVYTGTVETQLAAVNLDDGVLQVQGGDEIMVTYMDRMSAEGANVTRTFRIGLATDAQLTMISETSLDLYREVSALQKQGIVTDDWQIAAPLPGTVSDNLRDAQGIVLQKGVRIDRTRMSALSPGQAVYIEVKDFDRDRNLGRDGKPAGAATRDALPLRNAEGAVTDNYTDPRDKKEKPVFTLVTRKGRTIPVQLVETEERTGVFTATVPTQLMGALDKDGRPMPVPEGTLEVEENDGVSVSYYDTTPAATTKNALYSASLAFGKQLGRMSVGVEYTDPRQEDTKVFSQVTRVETNTLLSVRVEDPDGDTSKAREKFTVTVSTWAAPPVKSTDPTVPVPQPTRPPVTMTLVETGEHTGQFAGSIKLSPAGGANAVAASAGEYVTFTYTDLKNPSDKPAEVTGMIRVNIAEDAKVMIARQVEVSDPARPTAPPAMTWQPVTHFVPGAVHQVTISDGDVLPKPGGGLTAALAFAATNGAVLSLEMRGSGGSATTGTSFGGTFYVRLGDKKSPAETLLTQAGLVAEDELGETTDAGMGEKKTVQAVPTINVQGQDKVTFKYMEPLAADGTKNKEISFEFPVIADGSVLVLDLEGNPLTSLKPGMAFLAKVIDGSGDMMPGADKVKVKITSEAGDVLDADLSETGGHTGVFVGEFNTGYGATDLTNNVLEVAFSGTVTVTYNDEQNSAGAAAERSTTAAIDALATARAMLLTKVFEEPKFEVETLTRLAEALYSLGAVQLASTRIPAGQPRTNQELQDSSRLLQRVLERFPGSDFEVEALFLRGRICREEQKFDEAQALYERVINEYPDSQFVPQALYELVVLQNDRQDVEAAIETTKRLAHGYPSSPMVSDAFLRVAEYYYRQRNYLTSAQIYERVLVRFPDNPRFEAVKYRLSTIYYRIGMTDVKNLDYFAKAGRHYIEFVKMFPDSQFADDALYWGAQAYFKMGNANRAYTMLMRMVGVYSDSNVRREADQLLEQIKVQFKGVEIDPALFG